MQINLSRSADTDRFERRAGADRRGDNRSCAGQEWRSDESSLDPSAGSAYDPHDPYWEPVKGQDDD